MNTLTAVFRSIQPPTLRDMAKIQELSYCCTSRIALASGRYLCLTHFLSHFWEYRRKSYIAKKLDSLAYIFVADSAWYNFNHGDLIGLQNYRILWNIANGGHHAVEGHSRLSISVPMESSCGFLRMNDINVHPFLHRFLDTTDYWPNFRHRQGKMPLFNAFVVCDRWTIR